MNCATLAALHRMSPGKVRVKVRLRDKTKTSQNAQICPLIMTFVLILLKSLELTCRLRSTSRRRSVEEHVEESVSRIFLEQSYLVVIPDRDII